MAFRADVRLDESTAYVEATWQSDGDGTGGLTVAAASGTGFAGRSRAWFNTDAVSAFADRLRVIRSTTSTGRP